MVDDTVDSIALSADSPLVQQAEAVRLRAAETQLRQERAEAVIKANTIQAIMWGMVPVPVLDMVALTNVQFKMLDDLVKLYEIRYTKIERAVVKSCILGTLPVLAVTGLSSAVKVVPGIGSLVGSASVVVSAGALSYATGTVFMHHFAAGGNLDDFNRHEFMRQFRQELKRGKQVARELVKQLQLVQATHKADS